MNVIVRGDDDDLLVLLWHWRKWDSPIATLLILLAVFWVLPACFLRSALRVSLVVRSSIFEFSIIVLMVMDVDRLNGWNWKLTRLSQVTLLKVYYWIPFVSWRHSCGSVADECSSSSWSCCCVCSKGFHFVASRGAILILMKQKKLMITTRSDKNYIILRIIINIFCWRSVAVFIDLQQQQSCGLDAIIFFEVLICGRRQ
jgi:hypothetical protein